MTLTPEEEEQFPRVRRVYYLRFKDEAAWLASGIPSLPVTWDHVPDLPDYHVNVLANGVDTTGWPECKDPDTPRRVWL